MKVYVVAEVNIGYDNEPSILGVFKNEKDAEKCFTDYILNGEERELTYREKEGLDNGDYWGDYRLILTEEEVQ